MCLYMVEARGQPWVFFFRHICFLRQGFSPNRLYWLGKRPQGAAYLHFPCASITSTYHHAHFLYTWVLGIELRSSYFKYVPDFLPQPTFSHNNKQQTQPKTKHLLKWPQMAIYTYQYNYYGNTQYYINFLNNSNKHSISTLDMLPKGNTALKSCRVVALQSFQSHPTESWQEEEQGHRMSYYHPQDLLLSIFHLWDLPSFPTTFYPHALLKLTEKINKYTPHAMVQMLRKHRTCSPVQSRPGGPSPATK